MSEYDFRELERKWQERWERDGTFRAEPRHMEDGGPAPKFFLNMPYPYMNGLLHLGHSYTYMRGEVYCRYKRMKGYNVLFPFAFHCTGAPIITAANRVAEGEPTQLKILADMGIDAEAAEAFADPNHWADYFPAEAERDLRALGVCVDWRRKFITTSLNAWYDRFIRWQFTILKQRGYVVLGEHPVVWCPKENTPVGDHARIKGEGETPTDFTLLKFRLADGEQYLMAATLRPETVYGQTNLWLDPDYTYTIIEIGTGEGKRETWIVSEPCAHKLEEQGRSMERTGEVFGRDLLGRKALAPAIDRYIPVLPSKFCDPEKGTGIVTSVPSDAPDDWMGLRDLQDDPEKAAGWGLDDEAIAELKGIEPIPIIRSEGWGDLPAVEICEKMGITDQHDREKLTAAKKEIYKSGFYTGVMREECGEYGGMTVEEAKELIKTRLLEEHKADVLWELSGEVVCRCLTPAAVKLVSNQWFLAYGDQEWKETVKRAFSSMTLIPESSRAQFDHVVDWLRDWACTRELGLGTRLPWDEKWLIESLSDSTIYMAYYILSKYFHGGIGYGQTGGGEEGSMSGVDAAVYHDGLAQLWGEKGGPVPAGSLTDGFFDHVFHEKGDAPVISAATGVPPEMLEAMRADFRYWYPFDLRVTGKDLVQNHLTFTVFNHVGIFSERDWPRGFSINGFIKVDGQKMSKSTGNFFLLRDLLKQHGTDVVRFTLASGGDGVDDPNWDSDLARTMGKRLESLYSTCLDMWGKGREGECETLDLWLRSVTTSSLIRASEHMESMEFRSALKAGFFDLLNHMRWYLRRSGGDPHRETLTWFLENMVRVMTPFVPHLCEELWERFPGPEGGLVSEAAWPGPDEAMLMPTAERAERYVMDLMEDVTRVRKLVKGEASKVVLYTANRWKWSIRDAALGIALELRERGKSPDMGALMKLPEVQESLKLHGKQVGKYVGALLKNINSHRSELDSLKEEYLDEKKVLTDVADFLERELGLMVEIYEAGEEGSYDPRGKSAAASPMHPGIYME